MRSFTAAEITEHLLLSFTTRQQNISNNFSCKARECIYSFRMYWKLYLHHQESQNQIYAESNWTYKVDILENMFYD